MMVKIVECEPGSFACSSFVCFRYGRSKCKASGIFAVRIFTPYREEVIYNHLPVEVFKGSDSVRNYYFWGPRTIILPPEEFSVRTAVKIAGRRFWIPTDDMEIVLCKASTR